MKRRRFVFTIIVLLGFIIFFLTNKLFSAKMTENFQVDSSADFYVVSSKIIKSYQFNGDKVLESSSVNIKQPEYTRSDFSKGEIDNRFLLFSTGDLLSFSNIEEAVVSIDFQDGKIVRKITDKVSSTGSGYSEKFFYTFSDNTLYQFDKLVNETNSLLFSKSTLASTQFNGKDGKLYLVASRIPESDESIYETHLFTIEEETMEVLDDVLLDDDPNKIYGFTSSLVVDDLCIIPITLYRDRQFYEKTAGNQYLEYNLVTKEKTVYDLLESYPDLIFSSKSKDFLIFQHEPSMLSRNILSLVNRGTKECPTIDINSILESDDIEAADIISVNTTMDNKLLILTKSALILWNMDTNQLITKTDGDFSEAIYFWSAS